MAEDIPFSRDFTTPAGTLVGVSPLIRRIVADNPSPFTFTGTCTYVLGQGRVAVVDPGPALDGHLAALQAALAGESVEAILVTHTHRDHSPAARALQAATNAPIIGCGPHRASRPLGAHETGLDAGGDKDHVPDRELADGETLTVAGCTVTAVATPGHTANHLAFHVAEENALLSGDHVMAWSTTIVSPPDGSMADYMASLAKLLAREDRVYWPGHGGPVTQPHRFVRGLLNHRRQRETAILERIAAGDGTIDVIVPRLYEGLAAPLRPAAGMSVLAHVEDLVSRGAVACDGPVTRTSTFRMA